MKTLTNDDAKELIQNEDILATIDTCLKEGTFAKLRCHELLRQQPPPEDREEFTSTDKKSAEDSWTKPFVGETHDLLRRTIARYLDPGRAVYANYSVIVNSSGMGKSRLIDELSKSVVVIPLCLRAGQQGFPPPDKEIRRFLIPSSPLTRKEAKTKARELLFGLFTVLCDRLRGLPGFHRSWPPKPDVPAILEWRKALALAFRSKMTEGQTFDSRNQYRADFYRQVIQESQRATYDLRPVAGEICDLLLNKKRNYLIEPCVVLSFDESHDLTNTLSRKTWSMFSELRRVLSEIIESPIFSLFLSTSGSLHLFSPERNLDPSTRIKEGQVRQLPSITELGFDQLAPPIFEHRLKLANVTTVNFMAHLGRPLFGSRFDTGAPKVQRELVDFAREKLFGKTLAQVGDKPDFEVDLACLAVRFPIEFRPKNFAERSVEHRQVERHMRTCLAVGAGFEHMITVAPSEPLLAEAASFRSKHPLPSLVNNLDISGVDLGDRGELAAMMILMRARDSKAGPADSTSAAVVSVVDFLESLFPAEYHSPVLEALPYFWRREDSKKSLKNTFETSRLWFNHFIKVRDYDTLDVNHLWKLLVRGAAVLCATRQEGVDIVIPFLYEDSTIGADKISVILVQVKNIQRHRNVDTSLFASMSPRTLGVFPEGFPVLPVIRFVFYLGSDQSRVQVIERHWASDRTTAQVKWDEDYTAYDIWCSGCLPTTFAVLDDTEVEKMKVLLRGTQHVQDAYEVKEDKDKGNVGNQHADVELDKDRGNIRQTMYPGSQVSRHFVGYVGRAGSQ